MSEDLNKTIKQITDMLSQENLPDNVKGLLSLFANSGGNEGSSPKVSDSRPAAEEKVERNELDENIDMMRKVKKVMDKMSSSSDPRINLLSALRPFLNSRRQKKLNNCVNLLRMSSLTRLFENDEKGSL